MALKNDVRPSFSVRPELEQSLNRLLDDLLWMGSLVSNAIDQAMLALKTMDDGLAQTVIAGDATINALRFQIEAECTTLIIRHQPTATDLRTVIAVMNIIIDLERMGDHAAGIAKVGLRLSNHPPLKSLEMVLAMAAAGRDMLTRSLHAFISQNNCLATEVIAADEAVDRLYAQIFRQLILLMCHDPEAMTRAMYMLFAAHNLERIADLTTNIAERTMFRRAHYQTQVVLALDY